MNGVRQSRRACKGEEEGSVSSGVVGQDKLLLRTRLIHPQGAGEKDDAAGKPQVEVPECGSWARPAITRPGQLDDDDGARH